MENRNDREVYQMRFQNFSSLQFIPIPEKLKEKDFEFQNFSSLQFINYKKQTLAIFIIFQNFSSLQFICL